MGRLSRPEALEKGVDVRVSSWTRSAPNTFPAMAKSVANYANSSLIKMEAVIDGYSEGIALNPDGLLSEGSGQNLFLVRDGVLYTTPLSASVLPGITRDSIITLAKDMGLSVQVQDMPREMLYVSDEVFFVARRPRLRPSVRWTRSRLARAGAVRSPRASDCVLRLHQRRGARSPRLADPGFDSEARASSGRNRTLSYSFRPSGPAA
jgi:hypothetical protein